MFSQTNTFKNEKFSADYQRRKFYYQKKWRDKDSKHDKHPEIRAVYYNNYPEDKDRHSDRLAAPFIKW